MKDLWKIIFSDRMQLKMLIEKYLVHYKFVNSQTSEYLLNLLARFVEEPNIEMKPPFPEFEIIVDRNTIAKKFIKDLITQSENPKFLPTLSCFEIRALIGQRFTPASVTDCNTKIPELAILQKIAMIPYKQTPLTVAARALSKHKERSEFWGSLTGGANEWNRYSAKWIDFILKEKTWWNLFGHYRHRFIYEARIESGHGARWSSTTFIGFVEPFYDSKFQNLSVK